MCTEIQYKDNIIETPQELIEILGIPAEKLVVAKNYNIVIPNICLCQVDIEATLTKASYEYKKDETGYKITGEKS